MPESLPLNELHKTDRLIAKKNQKNNRVKI